MPPADLRAKRFLQFAVLVVVILFTLYSQWQKGNENPQPNPAPADPPEIVPAEVPDLAERSPLPKTPQRAEPPEATPASPAPLATNRLLTSVEGQVIRNLDGEVVFRGTVDLSATLQRIQAGKRLPFPNDGTVFQNREKRLPNKPSGHYREYVHPTPNLGGPGPQRIVKGNQGEYFYTPDHYRTFRKLNR